MNRSFIDDNGNPCNELAIQGENNFQNEVNLEPDQPQNQPSPSESHADSTQNQMYHPQEDTGSGGGSSGPPKYFINAAELSEDDTSFFLPDSSEPPTQKSNDQKNQEKLDKPLGESNSKTTTTKSGESKKQFISQLPRSRVPVSKSYPDIVQTTFGNSEDEGLQKSCFGGVKPHNTKSQKTSEALMAKENSDLDLIVADSLENLVQPAQDEMESESGKAVEQEKPAPQLHNHDDRPIRAFDKSMIHQHHPVKSGIMNSSAFMTESQMGGILGEKAPESWVIDLNSLSMESSEMTSSMRRSGGGGSGTNSLSFFVNMNAKPEKEDLMTSSTGPEKKIFSMFVDLKEDQEGRGSKKSQIPNLCKKQQQPLVVNKPVQNVMETSLTGSIKSSSSSTTSTTLGKKFPSPIFQHKAAAEAARQSARSDWEKHREKYYDSLEPNALMMSMMMMGQCQSHSHGGHTATATTMDDKESSLGLGESTISNRSSLHVANVLESSFNSSIMENSQGELEICQGGACFKLQLDLTRMFQEGINTDVNISVNGKWIRAHKCILASRSQYFAAILSGHWVEKAGNTINLDGFSYSVVQFALYHIYSGTNEIPDTIDLLELATLTDLLGLEGLRENISQTFRVKFCHNFHRPCTGCITGVLECFPIAVNYGMDELHRKMIKWICRHFVRIWPTKGFASLGEDLIDKCLKYSINHLSVDNILDHTLGCDQLTTTMPSLRWTETIFNIVHQLGEACIQFVGENLSDVLQSQKFLQFGKGQAWNISRIEGTFTQAMTLLRPDIACLSHTALSRLIELGTETIDEVEWSTGFVDFLKLLRDEVEKYLFANASKAVLSKCWEELSPAFRKKICSSSFVGFDKFGNKIVKNNATTSSSSSGGGSNSKTQQRQSQQGVSGSSSTSRTVKSNQNSAGNSRNSHSSAKVASVRPMQSQTQQNHVEVVEEPVEPQRRTLSNVTGRSGTMSSIKSDATEATTISATSTSRPNTASTTTVSRNLRRTSTSGGGGDNSRRTSMSTGSPTHSANRTPNKPLTPCGNLPSKSSPLLGTMDYSEKSAAKRPTQPLPGSATARNHALARQQSKPPPEPVKKAFLTNSAKAAAVSKPILRPGMKQQGATPTSSVSSISSVGQQSSHSPTPVSRQNSKPQASSTAAARNLANTGREGSFSARNSFSRVERPTTATSVNKVGVQASHTQQVTKFTNNPPPPRRNTFGHQNKSVVSNKQQQRPSSTSSVVKSNTTTTTTNRKQVSTSAKGGGGGSGHSAIIPQKKMTTANDFQSFSESFQQDSLVMSRSTIETTTTENNDGDVKMRTLAQIGRSSTFSKDEPTILGKMDQDYQDDDYDDDYEEDYE